MEVERLTKKIFDQIKDGNVIAKGVLPNSPDGLFMSDSGGELFWIAKKGFVNDWAIYCHWSWHTEEYILSNGDKIMSEEHIRKCVPCDDEVFKSYRY
jgi:hypothetical protein